MQQVMQYLPLKATSTAGKISEDYAKPKKKIIPCKNGARKYRHSNYTFYFEERLVSQDPSVKWHRLDSLEYTLSNK